MQIRLRNERTKIPQLYDPNGMGLLNVGAFVNILLMEGELNKYEDREETHQAEVERTKKDARQTGNRHNPTQLIPENISTIIRNGQNQKQDDQETTRGTEL